MILGGYEPRAYQQKVIDVIRINKAIQSIKNHRAAIQQLRYQIPRFENGEAIISPEELDQYIATAEDAIKRLEKVKKEIGKDE